MIAFFVHRRPAALAIAAALLLSQATVPVFAQDDGLGLGQPDDAHDATRFFGNDERVTVKPNTLPWRAIGKIVNASTGYCTGTLVGPDIVLTAAHCMFDEAEGGGGYVWDEPVYFLAGFHEGRIAAASHVADVWLPRSFDMASFLKTYDHDHEDFAFLRLEEPIGEQVGWLRIADLEDRDFRERLLGADGPKISQAGYSQDSNRRLTAHIGCRLVRFVDNDTVLHECDTMEGDSGSPLFFLDEGEYWLLALESQWLWLDGRIVNGAVDSRAFTAALVRFSADR